MKTRLITGAVAWAAALAAPALHAATQTFTFTSPPLPLEIPDDAGVTTTDSRTITSDIKQIDDISVSLTLVGSDGAGGFGKMWNGDLFLQLNYGSAYSILINRAGQTGPGDGGDSGDGIDVSLKDSNATDIHVSNVDSGLLSGSWQPDGRDVDPTAVVTGDPRTKLLDQFLTLDPNGQWDLILSDQGAGQFMRVQQWSLTITGQIPEVSTWAAGGFLALTLAGLVWRRRKT